MHRFPSWLPLAALLIALPATADVEQTKGSFKDKFRQLDEALPTANDYRTAGGEPGHEYWQQKVDYNIDVTLIEDRRRIEARQSIRYTNRSPDTLRFLWLQLDQNRFRDDSLAERSSAFADASRRGPSASRTSMRWRWPPPGCAASRARRSRRSRARSSTSGR